MGDPRVSILDGLARGATALGETLLALSPVAPAPQPAAASGVTAGYLEKVLGAKVPGARITSLELRLATTGTTDRQRIVLTWNAAGGDAALPTDLFVKSTPLSAKNRAMVASLSMAVNEVKFYNTARADVGDVAPEVFACHAGHGGRHLLVMQDLLSGGARPYALADSCTLEHARATMIALGRLHATFQDSPRFATDLSFAAPMTRRPGAAMLRMTMRRVRKTALRNRDEYRLNPTIERLLPTVQANDKALYRSWENGTQTLLHGDTHLGNTYSLPDGRAGLLDWQVVFRGRGMREVAYFAGAGLDTELRRAHERELIALYLDTIAEHGGTPPDKNEAWHDYRFFMYDTWDSATICRMWPGLQAPKNVERGCARVNAAIEDLEVDRAIIDQLERRST
jgi:aminoglycoside phosphotransferase (APT) family kinase protein